jgi:hypothetical protein
MFQIAGPTRTKPDLILRERALMSPSPGTKRAGKYCEQKSHFHRSALHGRTRAVRLILGGGAFYLGQPRFGLGSRKRCTAGDLTKSPDGASLSMTTGESA